jgi:hypothetical protein
VAEPTCPARAPTRPARLGVALVLGLLAGWFTAYSLGRPGFHGDFEFAWWGARLMLAGTNPYALTEYAGADIYGGAALFYPPPTLWLIAPLAWLPVQLAGAIVFGLSTAALAFLITRTEWWRLHLFLSGSFVMAASLGQWAPLLMVAALAPAARPLWFLKPSLGLAVLAYRPSRWAFIGAAGAVLASLVVLPDWPAWWVGGAAASPQHIAPLLVPWGGPLLLLAALRWRTARGRLLLVMACVPQFLFFYDQLLLWLMPCTRRESLWLTACNVAGVLLWIGACLYTDQPYQQLARPFVVVACYLPALVLVLREPGERQLGSPSQAPLRA